MSYVSSLPYEGLLPDWITKTLLVHAAPYRAHYVMPWIVAYWPSQGGS